MTGLIDDAIASLKAGLDIDDLTNFILNPAQQASFMEAMEVQTKVLPIIRSTRMEREKQNIDSIQFYGRVTVAGSASDGSVRTLTTSDKVTPSTEQNILDAKELVAVMGVKDRLLRRVIGQQNTATFLVNLLGNAAGRDFEELALLGNTDIAYNEDSVLHQTNGFALKAGNKLYGTGGSKDYGPTDKQYPFTMFDAMIEALPDRYLDNLPQYRFMVDWTDFNAALDMWGLRNTAQGDQALSTGVLPPYKGINILYVPLLNRVQSTEAKLAAGHTGRIAMLQNIQNMNWGIFHEMTMEPKRVPESRESEWYLSYEGDVQYQEKNAAVTAFHERESI